jgi:hypothetical protein
MFNIFSAHGAHYADNENRLTANLIFFLSEFRPTILAAFMRELGLVLTAGDLSRMRITFQPRVLAGRGVDIPDARLQLDDELVVLIEAKIGNNPLGLDQLRRYARVLTVSNAKTKRLVCITQIDETRTFQEIKGAIEPYILRVGDCRYFRWHQLLESMKKSTRLSREAMVASDRRIMRGARVDYGQRLMTLLLREVERTMYDKKVVDEIPSGELQDVVITTQEPWFMDMAKRHRVWFPSGETRHGLRSTRYVAYYEVDHPGNENRKHIAYVARNLVYWNAITMSEALTLPELAHVFADKEAREEMEQWPNEREHHTFHIVLTEPPMRLKKPIPLRRNYARVLAKRRYSLVDFVNAETIDDLFAGPESQGFAAPSQPVPLQIRWVVVPELALDHGVQFHHQAAGEPAVAFLEGFGWRDEKEHMATIQVLDREQSGWPEIVQDVKAALEVFLASPKHGPVTASVRAVFNA